MCIYTHSVYNQIVLSDMLQPNDACLDVITSQEISTANTRGYWFWYQDY